MLLRLLQIEGNVFSSSSSKNRKKDIFDFFGGANEERTNFFGCRLPEAVKTSKKIPFFFFSSRAKIFVYLAFAIEPAKCSTDMMTMKRAIFDSEGGGRKNQPQHSLILDDIFFFQRTCRFSQDLVTDDCFAWRQARVKMSLAT